MKTWLYQWIKTNSVILMNASSLIGTSVVTSGLGFVYWLVAARFFPPQVLGFSSATVSTMTLLGFFCTLGLGTLLMGELSHQSGNEFSLISASMIVVGLVGGCAGVIFALIAPFVSTDFQILRVGIANTVLFAVGVSFSAITFVLDGAFTGLLRSELQLWRNTVFAVVKLVALLAAGLWLSHALGLTIYTTWTIGNICSLVVFAGFALSKREHRRNYLPRWRLLRTLAPAAFQHHMLNVVLDIPTLALPLVVTITLSATANAWFYVSYMLAGFTFVVPFALTLVLFAMNSDQLPALVRKTRLTLSIAFITIVFANLVLQLGATQLLGLFGHMYSEQAAWCLRILGLAAFPIIIKNHYIAISRIQGRMTRAMLPIAIGTLFELGGAVIGGRLGGIAGLSFGWLVALCMEAMFMASTVYMFVRPKGVVAEREQSERVNMVFEQGQESKSKSQLIVGNISPDALNCPHCHAILPSWAGFCSSCGKQIEKGESEEKQIEAANDDNDIHELEAETLHVPAFSQEYAKRWQASQASRNTTIIEQTHTGSSLDQKIEVPQQPSPSEIVDRAELVDVQTQNDHLIPSAPSQVLTSVADTPVPETWQHIPTTDAPASLPVTTPLPVPTVSYIPQRTLALSPATLLWPAVIFLSAVSAGLVNFVFTASAIRPIVMLWFLCVCPGMIFVRSLRLKEPVVEWTLAFALSFTIDALVAGIQLYTGLWSAAGTLSILMSFCLIVTTAQLLGRIATTGIPLHRVTKAINGVLTATIHPKSTLLSFKWLDSIDVALLLLPLLALLLWSISLQKVSLNAMNNLGLISALSPGIIVALSILVVSFVLSLQRSTLRVPLLTFQLTCIILILYTTPQLLEEMPRFAPIYRSAGYTDYILQTGTVNAQLDFYFNLPGFYVLSAFFTKAFGYSTILSYAGWGSLFNTLLYIGPMYIIFTSITSNKRLVWLGLLFFYLTNWVGQDYFSPQALNFFLYLVIIMILLKWFRILPKPQIQLKKNTSLARKIVAWLKAPDAPSSLIEPWQQRGLLCCLLLIFGLVVFSHPLTPFFTLLSVFLLVIFRRCRPFWLPMLLLAMTAFWDLVIAGSYIFQHYNLLASLGHLFNNVPPSITSGKLSGDALYHVIATMRLVMTVLLWVLAFLGGVKRLRQGNKDITLILLAISGFPMIAGQGYGGEMLARIYLFTEPFMCFFAASLLFDNSVVAALRPARPHTTFSLKTAAILGVSLLLLGSFFFTRYGDERVDYVSYGEWNAVQRLYQIAPANALILAGWNYCPLYFKDYTKYNIQFLDTAYREAVVNTNANGIIDLIENEGSHPAYIIFSQEEQIYATAYNGLPNDILQRLETRLLQTGKFTLLYRNSDAQILQFVGNTGSP